MQFELDVTTNSKAFFEAYPDYHQAFDEVLKLGNLCLGRSIKFRNSLDKIIFGLGHRCREDFTEVAFLAVNGYPDGAQKIVRSLFERAVTTSHLINHPEKIDKFIGYNDIHTHRVYQAALRSGMTASDWNKFTRSEDGATKVEALYKEAVPNYKETLCKTCKTSKTKFSWDISLSEMVAKLGENFERMYFPAYAIPNLSVHTNVMSAYLGDRDIAALKTRKIQEVVPTLAAALVVFLDVCQAQAKFFEITIPETDLNIVVNSIRKVLPKNI